MKFNFGKYESEVKSKAAPVGGVGAEGARGRVRGGASTGLGPLSMMMNFLIADAKSNDGKVTGHGTSMWVAGTVTACHEDGTADIKADDGSGKVVVHINVPKDMIRIVPTLNEWSPSREPEWIVLRKDRVVDMIKDVEFPGCLLMKLSFGRGSKEKKVQEQVIKSSLYQVALFKRFSIIYICTNHRCCNRPGHKFI